MASREDKKEIGPGVAFVVDVPTLGWRKQTFFCQLVGECKIKLVSLVSYKIVIQLLLAAEVFSDVNTCIATISFQKHYIFYMKRMTQISVDINAIFWYIHDM